MSFDNNDKQQFAYKNLDFSVNVGEFFCIVGPSGCGKTSLLRTMVGLQPQTSGDLVVAPREGGQTADIGMIFQAQGLFPWMSVRRNVSFVLENNTGIEKKTITDTVDDFLQRVGLSDYADYYPHQLSGGMKQRVSIARSFANNPDILLMDEPFVFLDFHTRLKLQSLLLTLWRASQKTVVFVTHDIEEAVLLADRVMVMSASPGTIKDIVSINLSRPRDIFKLKASSDFGAYVNGIMQMLKGELDLPESL